MIVWVLLTFPILFIACGHGRLNQQVAQPQTITVCDVFQDLGSYRGKMVAVRGIYQDGLRQMDCPKKLITGKHEWPAALWMVGSNYTPEGEKHVAFETDLRSWNDLERIAARQRKIREHVEIWATVVGQLRVRKTYLTKTGDVQTGYGHLGIYPAEIVVKSIRDVAVKSK